MDVIAPLRDEERIAYAGRLARRRLRALLADRASYPQSYDRERFLEKADEILDESLELADTARTSVTCVVCDDAGCEFCPRRF